MNGVSLEHRKPKEIPSLLVGLAPSRAFPSFFRISASLNKSGTRLRCHKPPTGRSLASIQLAKSAIQEIWCLVVCLALATVMKVSFLSLSPPSHVLPPPPQARSQREVRFTIIPAFSQEETPPNKPKVTSRSERKRAASASCQLCLRLP